MTNEIKQAVKTIIAGFLSFHKKLEPKEILEIVIQQCFQTAYEMQIALTEATPRECFYYVGKDQWVLREFRRGEVSPRFKSQLELFQWMGQNGYRPIAGTDNEVLRIFNGG